MSRLADHWENEDVRVRPGRRTRPRTKTRPDHEQAVPGQVLTVDRGRYGCLVDVGRRSERVITAMRARELGRRGVVVGDLVELVGDVDGGPDALARIVRIAPRRTELRRSTDDQVDPDTGAVLPGATERLLVANAEQLVIVTAAADPEPRPGFIDRCMVAAYTGYLRPLLVITKIDLAGPEPLERMYRDLDLPILTTGRTERGRPPQGLEAVADRLRGRMSVLVGQSGVGKSTLVNALVPAADRATGQVTGVGKGRHTSTSAVALALPQGGYVIDTPGLRTFGLAHVTPDDLLETFDDLLPVTADCPAGCDHAGTPGSACALDAAAARGEVSPTRLESFRRLLASRSET